MRTERVVCTAQMYRVLFTAVMVGNTIALVMAAIGRFPLAKENSAQIAVTNELICVLVRNEVGPASFTSAATETQ